MVIQYDCMSNGVGSFSMIARAMEYGHSVWLYEQWNRVI